MEYESLAARLPWESIVRYPAKVDPTTLDRAYWQNCIELSDFIRESLRADGKTIHLDVLATDETFETWLMACHRLVCGGSAGDRHYGGQSEIGFDPADHAGQRRTAETQVHWPVSAEIVDHVGGVARQLGDPDAGLLDLSRYRSGGAVAEPLVLPELRTYGARADGAERVHCTLFYYGDDRFAYGFPMPAYIGEYLSLMRAKLLEAVCAWNGDPGLGAARLAHAYQLGSRAQAVAGVCSVLMGIVNELLGIICERRLAHELHDYMALLLSQGAFERYFRLKIEVALGAPHGSG